MKQVFKIKSKLCMLLTIIIILLLPGNMVRINVYAEDNVRIENFESYATGCFCAPKVYGNWEYSLLNANEGDDASGVPSQTWDNPPLIGIADKTMFTSSLTNTSKALRLMGNHSENGCNRSARITSLIGSFKLVSFRVEDCKSYSDNSSADFIVAGYKEKKPVVGAVQSFTAPSNQPALVMVNGDVWNNIDEFRISLKSDSPSKSTLDILIDDIMVQNPVVQSIPVILPKVSNVTFSNMGVAQWIKVDNALGYEVKLYKNQFQQVEAISKGESDLSCDFLSSMRKGGYGIYTVKVTAKGDGNKYLDGPQSDSSEGRMVIQLAEVNKGINWSGNIAHWYPVDNALSYDVQLYRDGKELGSPQNVWSIVAVAGVDFTSSITAAGNGTYTYKVTARGDGALILDAEQSSESDKNIMPVPTDTTAPIVTGVEDGKSYNKDVIINFNEGTATLDSNSFINGGTVTSEGYHILIVLDEVGNKTTINFTIDKTPPKVIGVEDGKVYNSEVTIKFNEGKAILDGQSFTNGSKVNLEGQHVLLVTDEAGNNTIVNFMISKIIPKGTISYSTTSPTNKDVIATLVVENGVTIINNNGLNIYTFKENGTFTFVFKDTAGNIGTAEATVNNIDKISPLIYGIEDGKSYNTDVVITFNEGTAELNGKSLESGDKVSDEGEYKLVVKDPAGNETIIDFIIDKTPPIGTIEYSTTNPTNDNVIATLVVDGDVKVTNNNGLKTYIFSQNGSFIFEFEDTAGNKGTATATVNNINKTSIIGTVEYSTTSPTNGNVVATLVVGNNIRVTNNNGSNIYTFYQNGSFTFEFEDTSGNKGTAVAAVSNIDKIPPVISGVENGKTYNTQLTITFNEGTATLNDERFRNGDRVEDEGNYEIIVTDEAGNKTTVGFSIDLTAPQVAGVTNGAIYNREVTISFNEGTATLDQQNFINQGRVSTEGNHVLVVTDRAGNKTTVWFNINMSAPKISGVEEGKIYNTEITINFEGVYATLDGINFINGSKVSTEGNHLLIVTDTNGRTAKVNFAIDMTPPVVTGVEEGKEYSPEVTINFNEGTGVLDGESFNSGSNVSNEGKHELVVTDEAGNTTTVNFVIGSTNTTDTGNRDQTTDRTHDSNERYADINIGDITNNKAWNNVQQVAITREEIENGEKQDTIAIDNRDIDEVLNKISKQNKDSIQIKITDSPGDNADKLIFNFRSQVIKRLACSKLNLEITSDKGKFAVSNQELYKLRNTGIDAQIVMHSIKDLGEIDRIHNEIKKSMQGIVQLGNPVFIETNLSVKSKITIPLSGIIIPDNKNDLERLLEQLAVYVQYNDESTEVIKGEAQYDSDGKINGLSIWANKFYSFTPIVLTNTSETKPDIKETANQTKDAKIDTSKNTIILNMPNGSDLKNVVITIKISDEVKTDSNGKTTGININLSALSSSKDITGFTTSNQVGKPVINTKNSTVIFYVNKGTNIKSLIPKIELSKGASITPKSGQKQNFTNPVKYTVTAQNGTKKVWTIRCIIIQTPTKTK